MAERIPTHRPPRLGDRPSASKRGYGSHHRRLRKWFLARNPVCLDVLANGSVCGQPATEMDHVDGDVTNIRIDNLRGRCKRCHSAKTVRCDGGLGLKPVQTSALALAEVSADASSCQAAACGLGSPIVP